MAKQDGKWVTINGRHVFIPKGKKLEDVWDYQNNGPKEDNFEEDLSDYEDENYEEDIDELSMSGMTDEEKEIYKAHKEEIDGDLDKEENFNDRKKALKQNEFKKGDKVRIAKEFGDNSREFEIVDVKNGFKGITIKETGRDGITYQVDKSQLEGYKPNNYAESPYGSKQEYNNNTEEKDLMNPNNPKYKGFSRSNITNAKLVDKGKKIHNYDTNEDETLSIIEYIPYGALQDGDNRKLYGVVTNYDGSDAPDIGAIVSPSLESAKNDLESQITLAEQGSEKYLKRGKWDEDWFKMLSDKTYEWDEDTLNHYKEKYGWDFSKPWEEQEHVKSSKK